MGEYDRHYCNRCKRKLFERDMKDTGRETRYRKKIWLCNKCFSNNPRIYVY